MYIAKWQIGGKIMRLKYLLGLNPLIQPSSASAEQVFSILQNSFTHQQHSSLEDYISVFCMLQ